jgi:hypothetical protein
MQERRTQQIPSCYPRADKKALHRSAAAADTRPGKLGFGTRRRPRPAPDIGTDERYFSIPLSLRGRHWSVEVHKGIAIGLPTSAALWVGVIVAIRAWL